MKKIYKRFEKTVSSLKFAVIITLLLAVACIYGTFMESYHGTEYAGRTVYKSWWFMGIQLFMFLSILLSTIVRLPFKKRLYGFYVIHLGLMIIFTGSLITYILGVDGTIELLPSKPSNKIMVNEDVLKIQFLQEKKTFSYKLPYTGSPIDIDSDFKNIKVKRYYPFSKTVTEWQQPLGNSGSSGQYFLYNENFGETVTLSLNPSADFKSIERLGLLNIHYMPAHFHDCFLKPSETGFIFWNLENNSCFTAEEKNLKLQTTPTGTDFVELEVAGERKRFFPNFSPVALRDDFSKELQVPMRVLSRKLFEKKPHLFLFGEKLAFYRKGRQKWVGRSFAGEEAVRLPWMNFKIKLEKYSKDLIPVQVPYYTKPVQINNEVVEGDTRALEIEFAGQNYWVRSDAPLSVSNSQETINFILTKRDITLPYQITLKEFVMEKDPGTTRAASYESYVDLLDGRNTQGASTHHVFMNNPLKYDDFTFYQSSYFQVAKDQYASVFSVNLDPGRPVKYLGCILLVLGSIWHYLIRRKKARA